MKINFKKKYLKYKKKYLYLKKLSQNGSGLTEKTSELIDKMHGVTECFNNGNGKFTSLFGLSYEGEVKNGIPNGYGRITYNDLFYEGEFKDGYFIQGFLKNLNNNDIFLIEDGEDSFYTYDLKDVSGECVKGNCHDGIEKKIIDKVSHFDCEYSGKVVFSSDDGYSYDGEVKKGIPDGLGKLTVANILFDGEFKDRFFRQGIIKINNKLFLLDGSDIWDVKELKKKVYGDSGGKCVKGKCQDGIGKIIKNHFDNFDDLFYEGEFKYGLPHGKGDLRIYDEKKKKAIKIVGEFFYSIPKNIKIKSLDGETFEGELNIIPLTKKYGKQTMPDGEVYEGEFKDNMGHGQGKLTYKDGSYHEGEFKDGSIYKGKYYNKYGELRDDGEFYIKDNKPKILNGKVYFDGFTFIIKDGKPIN